MLFTNTCISARAEHVRHCDTDVQLQKARPEVERLAAQLRQEQEVRLDAELFWLARLPAASFAINHIPHTLRCYCIAGEVLAVNTSIMK